MSLMHIYIAGNSRAVLESQGKEKKNIKFFYFSSNKYFFDKIFNILLYFLRAFLNQQKFS